MLALSVALTNKRVVFFGHPRIFVSLKFCIQIEQLQSAQSCNITSAAVSLANINQ